MEDTHSNSDMLPRTTRRKTTSKTKSVLVQCNEGYNILDRGKQNWEKFSKSEFRFETVHCCFLASCLLRVCNLDTLEGVMIHNTFRSASNSRAVFPVLGAHGILCSLFGKEVPTSMIEERRRDRATAAVYIRRRDRATCAVYGEETEQQPLSREKRPSNSRCLRRRDRATAAV